VCITRKGDPALQLLTNRGWENHLCASSVFARGNSIGGRTDDSIDTGLNKFLGYYPNNQHEMLHTDAVQQRPGNLPASAPEASQQKSPRAQKQANPGRPASQRRKSQPGDTTAADRTAGTMDTSHISVIHDGLAPPPPWNSTCTHHNRTGTARAQGPACTIPSPRGRKRASRQQHPAVATRIYAPCNLCPMQPLPHALCSRHNPPLRPRPSPSA